MHKEIIYKYLGTNGIIESPVHLEGIYSVKTFSLTPKAGYILTNGEKKVSNIKVSADELNDWYEIPIGQE